MSRPKAALYGFLLGLAALTAEALTLGGAVTAEDPSRLVAWILTYVCVAYCYIFGFYNVGESARRVRLLIELREAGARGLALEEILAAYNARTITTARLERLVAGRQVVEIDGRYVSGRTDMLIVARVLNFWKWLAFGPVIHVDRPLSWSGRR